MSSSSKPSMYNRDRRLSTLLSSTDTLSDIDTRAQDQYRPVSHEHSITSFLERKSSLTDVHCHDCHSPLEHESTGGRDWFADSAEVIPSPTLASAQGEKRPHEAPTPVKDRFLVEGTQPRRHQRRGTMDNGSILRHERGMESPPPSPISERS